jgi:ribosomal protein S18 acetylase RimI-like enzyme
MRHDVCKAYLQKVGGNMPMPNIRPAVSADVPAIAQVHVASWRTTYRGIIADDVLDNLQLEPRERYAARIIAQPDGKEFISVAEDDAGQIIGFASGGPEREGDPDYRGELYAIYLLQAAQGQGVGRRLVMAVVQRLAQQGLHSMLIWVAADNPACRFYEALGGQYVRDKIETFGGTPIREIAYGWRDTQALMPTGT